MGKAYNEKLISLGDTFKSLDTCVALVNERAKALNTNNVLVLLHGYANRFPATLARARSFAEDIDFEGIVVIWSWPANGPVSMYDDDSQAVDWSIEHFQEFYARLLRGRARKNVDLLAHSMGNRILVNVVRRAKERPSGEWGRSFVFAAPDVANDEFKQKASSVTDHFRTLYSSGYDRALWVAKYLNRQPRAGRYETEMLVLDGVESIDAVIPPRLFETGHPYVYEDARMLRDIRKIVTRQERAAARDLTERNTLTGGKFWVINP